MLWMTLLGKYGAFELIWAYICLYCELGTLPHLSESQLPHLQNRNIPLQDIKMHKGEHM